MGLYERTRQVWQMTQAMQAKKGEKKYGVSLENAGLSGADLVNHAMQENVDQAHYIMAMADVFNQQQDRISKLEEEKRLLKALIKSSPDFGPVFKPGDRVRKRDGSPFTNDKLVVTIAERKAQNPQHVWLVETNTHVHIRDLKHDTSVTPPVQPKTIRHLCDAAYKNALHKGWHDEPRTFGELVSLVHSELSEALEDHRNGKGFTETWYEGDKPCGIPSELADVCIRVFDMCGAYGIDLGGMIIEKMAYNETRPYRHNGKKL